MKWYFNGVALLVMSTPAILYPQIKSNSRVLPDIPTEKDSICIETCIYNWSGSLIDSSLSIAGNDILITYTASNPSVEPHLVVRKNSIGTLASGLYRIITKGYFLKKGTGTVDTTSCSHDTVRFDVLPAAAKPLRVVGYTLYIGYPFVDDPHPRRSYFCWNGDTLTIGMAFYYGAFASTFFAGVRQLSDTIVIDIVDTTLNQALLFNGYIAVTSLAPVLQSTHHVRIRRGNWGPYSNYYDPDFHRFIADPRSRGFSLSFREPKATEFVLCPNDTMYMDFWIQSPFLDTLEIIGLGPNPNYRPQGTERIFIHDMNHGNALIEDWESYDKNDWHYVLAQENDRLTFDTVCNSATNDHWIHMTYANDNNDPVRGFYYRTLDREVTSSSELPYVRVFGAVKDPENSQAIRPQVLARNTVTAPRVRYSGSSIAVNFYHNGIRSIHRSDRLNAKVTDMQGKLIRILGYGDVQFCEQGILAIWNGRDMRDEPVRKGLYIIRVSEAQWGKCVVVVIQ